MLLQELNDLKDGDQVVYISNDHSIGLPPIGTILTRSKNWMDDDLCVKFTFVIGDKKDFHYFNHEDVDFIK
jgi:hypothetical protein